MKTKITNISPDQNIITHESGLKTKFVPTSEDFNNCKFCAYSGLLNCFALNKPCDPSVRRDLNWGHFKPLLP